MTVFFNLIMGLVGKVVSPMKALAIGAGLLVAYFGYSYVSGLSEDNDSLRSDKSKLEANIADHVEVNNGLTATIKRVEAEYKEALVYTQELNDEKLHLGHELTLINDKYLAASEELSNYKGRLTNVGIKKPTAAERIADAALVKRMRLVAGLTSRQTSNGTEVTDGSYGGSDPATE